MASAVPAEVGFEIPSPLWRRWWFLSLLAAALGFLVYGAHRYHLERQLELERVRVRIATDLHDDLGAGLSRVAILSEIVTAGHGAAQSDTGRHLSEIAETARGLVDGMSDIVWAIDPRRDDLRSLVRRVRQFLSETLEPNGVDWSLDAPPDLETLALSPDQRRHVFLLVKEAVHNAARHARCSRVTVTIAVVHGECLVGIRDDGCGLPRPEPQSGNGLGNMRARAAALRGTFEIAPSPVAARRPTCDFPLPGRTSMLYREAAGMELNEGGR